MSNPTVDTEQQTSLWKLIPALASKLLRRGVEVADRGLNITDNVLGGCEDISEVWASGCKNFKIEYNEQAAADLALLKADIAKQIKESKQVK